MEYLTKLNGYNAEASLKQYETENVLYVEVIMCEEVRNDLANEIIKKEDLTYTDKRNRSYDLGEIQEDYENEFNTTFEPMCLEYVTCLKSM